MLFDDSKIKQILLSGNYVEEKDIEKAEEYAKEHRGSLIEYLLGEDLLSQEILGQAIAESFGVPFSNLSENRPKKEQVLLIPEDIAKRKRKGRTNHSKAFNRNHFGSYWCLGLGYCKKCYHLG